MVPLDRPAAFLEQLRPLVQSQQLRRQIGARARATVLEHSWERIIGQIEQVFIGLIDRNPLPGGLGAPWSAAALPPAAAGGGGAPQQPGRAASGSAG
jgi:hypothetical protein